VAGKPSRPEWSTPYTAAVARPLIIRITIAGAFLALNCENQPHALALDDANLRHLNVRICEQGIGAAAWDFPIVAHSPLGQIMKDAKTQFFWPIYSAIVHELQLVGCQPMMEEERNSPPFSSAYG
jgi:hypothetical protein